MSAQDIRAVDARFAERLRLMRQARNMTAHRLAEQAGLPTDAVHRIEMPRAGKRQRDTTIGEAVVLCQVLGIDLAHMVAEDVLHVPAALGGER